MRLREFIENAADLPRNVERAVFGRWPDAREVARRPHGRGMGLDARLVVAGIKDEIVTIDFFSTSPH